MHEHEHQLEDGTIIHHTHTHTQTKAVLNRMARLIGHLESTKKMIEDGRDCSEVLIQLSAVDAAIKAVGRIILKDHIEHCIVDAVKTGDTAEIERLNKAIEQFIR
ncbi:MAG: metal-sensing transcriptional repressor [Selenomonadaceae bacterium]|nr:metal-sensing transcriptional repressor [Selenomonadaceae bacterium]